jgi:hypothetical protein
MPAAASELGIYERLPRVHDREVVDELHVTSLKLECQGVFRCNNFQQIECLMLLGCDWCQVWVARSLRTSKEVASCEIENDLSSLAEKERAIKFRLLGPEASIVSICLRRREPLSSYESHSQGCFKSSTMSGLVPSNSL